MCWVDASCALERGVYVVDPNPAKEETDFQGEAHEHDVNFNNTGRPPPRFWCLSLLSLTTGASVGGHGSLYRTVMINGDLLGKRVKPL